MKKIVFCSMFCLIAFTQCKKEELIDGVDETLSI